MLIVIVSIIILAVIATVSKLLSSFHNFRLSNILPIRVIGVEAYGGNVNTTQDGKQYIDWGTVYPGTVENRSFYIKSSSNTPVTLNLTFANLTFFNSEEENVTENMPTGDLVSVTWNYNETLLNPNEHIYVTLTLKVSSNSVFLEYLITSDVRKFSFDIVITALEQ